LQKSPTHQRAWLAPKHAPTRYRGVIVFFKIGQEAFAASMPATDPDAAFNLNGHLEIRPRKIEAPLAGGMESKLWRGLWQSEAAKDVGEGHA
jgi:hypothetical protein